MYKTLLTTFWVLLQNIPTKYTVSEPIKRNIKSKEKNLGRICGKIWIHRNPAGTIYMFANFCKNYSRLIVTLGYYNPTIDKFVPAY